LEVAILGQVFVVVSRCRQLSAVRKRLQPARQGFFDPAGEASKSCSVFPADRKMIEEAKETPPIPPETMQNHLAKSVSID